mmetsp:Transcript_37432/g.49221  ORF Transcript_37432/g.49221 Transcript_37432/m.49221 type:complete len:124 (+) Transcript_37432:706-1077(+)
MNIKINEKAFKANNDYIKPKDYRTVVRKPDMAGKFKWINIELEEIASQYSKDMDEVLQIFEQVNCDKNRLRDRLEGNTFCIWKKIEDVTLCNYWEQTKANGGVPPQNNAHYQCLLEEKGAAEI